MVTQFAGGAARSRILSIMGAMKLFFVALLLAFTATAQSDPWAPIRVFEGKWQGTVTGRPGTQFSRREYRFELDGKFLSQRDDSVYEAKSPDGRQRTRTDFGFFSYDKIANKLVWSSTSTRWNR